MYRRDCGEKNLGSGFGLGLETMEQSPALPKLALERGTRSCTVKAVAVTHMGQ